MGQNRTTSNGQPKPEEWPVVATVAEWHRLVPPMSRDFMYQAIQTGELRALRRGRKILVPRSALLTLLGEPLAPTAPEG